MLNTYRKWKNTKEVFYISLYDKKEYYCEDNWWEYSSWFKEEILKKESKPANIYDIAKYKIIKWLNEK